MAVEKGSECKNLNSLYFYLTNQLEYFIYLYKKLYVAVQKV